MTQFTIVVDCNDPQYTREICAAFALFPEVKAVLPEDPAAR
ncbi:2-hydroxyacid dehydrogenase, partial [Klebsiella michiganensis]